MHIVLDLETKHLAEELEGGWADLDKMGVACVVIYCVDDDSFGLFGDSPGDVERAKEYVLAADRVTGFNSWSFDMPVLFGFNREAWQHGEAAAAIRRDLTPKTDDLLRRIRLGLGENPDAPGSKQRGWTLNAVARATLSSRVKNGDGKYAVSLYRHGDWASLLDYCLNDVLITRDLALFSDRYGYLRNEQYVVKLPPWQGSAEPVVVRR